MIADRVPVLDRRDQVVLRFDIVRCRGFAAVDVVRDLIRLVRVTHGQVEKVFAGGHRHA
jgi:hypothetical protein